jgi:hypothetical protein
MMNYVVVALHLDVELFFCSGGGWAHRLDCGEAAVSPGGQQPAISLGLEAPRGLEDSRGPGASPIDARGSGQTRTVQTRQIPNATSTLSMVRTLSTVGRTLLT